MSVIIDKRKHFTNGVSVSIPYDITQLELYRGKLQVKFDAKIIDGVGSKFTIRHSDGEHKGIGDYTSPLMVSSVKGTSHVYTVDLTNEIIQNSKFFTVTTNGIVGTHKINLEVTNIEITTFGTRMAVGTQMLRIAGRDDSGRARAIKVNEQGELQTDNRGVVVVSSEQPKPLVATEGKTLLESDTGKIFYYDGAEWREFI